MVQAVFYLSKYIAKSVDYDISISQYVRIRKMRFFNSYGFKGIQFKKEVWAKFIRLTPATQTLASTMAKMNKDEKDAVILAFYSINLAPRTTEVEGTRG